MTDHNSNPHPLNPPLTPEPAPLSRQPYVAPRLRPLGSWSVLTLAGSLPIGPGSLYYRGYKD